MKAFAVGERRARIQARGRLAGASWIAAGLILGWAIGLAAVGTRAIAQTAGEGGLQGTVTDPSGAVIPNATVTATDQASGLTTTRITSAAGFYTIAPLIPDTYAVTVSAANFKTSTQKNVVVNGYNVTGYNVALAVGRASQTVIVNTAPPELNTTNTTLGGVIDTKTYESLPILMNNQQRDPTAFATLLPGAQASDRAPNMSGTGGYLSEVYVDGVPTTTPNMQSDNRIVSLGMPLESIGQLQVMSSGLTAEYQGAGAIAFTTRSGGDHYHGTVADFIRNTAFDTWGFTAPAATVRNADGVNVPAGKPVEHQNEFVASVGGPVPHTGHKLFFFDSYDRYHGRSGVTPETETIPTTLMRTGNFSELLGTSPAGAITGQIYDPLTSAACTAHSTTGPCRYQYGYGYGGQPGPSGNPAPNGSGPNVIPSSEISGIAQYMQQWLPTPTSAGIFNNYLQGGGDVSGYNDYETVTKIDYDVTPRQRVSFVFSHGVRESIGYGAQLPLPYTNATSSIVSPTQISLQDSWVLTPRLINQFTYGFTRFPQPQFSPTYNLAPYRAAQDIGIGNLPPGQASTNFPGATFATTTLFLYGIEEWAGIASGSNSNHFTVPNAYTVVDNLQWNKGRHAMTFGVQTQWLEDNKSNQNSYSYVLGQAYTANDTAPFNGSTIATAAGGYSYASYLLGAVNSGSTTLQAFSETGGRFHPWSPYFQDNFRVTPKLTLNLGLRWDYLPPYHEVRDNWSYFNPNITNSITGTPGQLEFAGHRGADISCECRTPVQTYWKNWGPRLGFEFAPNEKTVFSGGWSVTYSRAGGVGGRAGDSTGVSQDGFTANLILPPAVNTGVNAGPSYYLNNSTAFQAAGLANVNFGGPGFVLPAPVAPNASALTFGTGNYVSNGSYVTPGSAPGYPDPYLSGRAPEFIFYNFGLQRILSNDVTIQATYSGSQGHFLSGPTEPGFWSGTLNTSYIAPLASVVGTDNATNILNSPATPANIAIAQKALPGITVPYQGFVQTQSGNPNSNATISRMLKPFPQYSSPPTPTWDNVGNTNYNALQITLRQRTWHGVSYNLNYTYLHNQENSGSPSAWPVPGNLTSNGVSYAGNNHGGQSTLSGKHVLNVFGVGQLPFGRGHIGSNSFLVRTLAGGWSLSGLFTYGSGAPMEVAGYNCTAPSLACRPDIDPNFSGPIRRNGHYGKGLTAAKLTAIQYLNPAAFQPPPTFPLAPGSKTLAANAISKLGDSGLYPFNLWGPGAYELDVSLRRSFNITPERVKFIFQADCTNAPNKVTWGNPNTSWSPNSSTFGTEGSPSGNRDFQFAGRINF